VFSLKGKRKEMIRGDKLRELIFFVYLNSKYGTGVVDIPKLKETLGYSTGGIYNALDESGYFTRKGDEVSLTSKGAEYFKEKHMPYYSMVNPLSGLLIVLGTLALTRSLLETFTGISLVLFNWQSGLALLAGGITLRFFFLRLMFYFMKLRKEL